MDPIAVLPKHLRRAARNYLARRGFAPIFDPTKVDTIWIDVGANRGQYSLPCARENPNLLVFAFEPNWMLARQIMAQMANFVVLPMAVSDSDGLGEFFVNTCDVSSSLARIQEAGLTHWKDFDLRVQSTAVVQTIRIDTFMRLAGLPAVDFLKVDAEGLDLRVVQSAGERLKDIRKIMLEVDIAPERLYQGAPSHSEVMNFMLESGFGLIEREVQNDGRQENLTFARGK